jgi:hypothetical protein
MSCDLTSGRLLNECSVGRAGIKTLYFTKFNDFAALTGITESGGEITDLGSPAIILYKFEMANNVGVSNETLNRSDENGSVYIQQDITLTLFNILPSDLAALNALKKGRWAIWALDYQDKIRQFGETRGCIASGGSDVSGQAPGDKRGLDLTLTAITDRYAPFMADFTTEPFDNFANVTVTITGYGPELHTDANAASDPNGNEADATTGWTPTGLTGTGANVFESQSSVVNTGSYALHANANDTPTSGAKFLKSFTVDSGDTYLIRAAVRHVGTGGTWYFYADGNVVGQILTASTTFTNVELEFVASGASIDVQFIEVNGTNNGGVYADAISLRKKL